MAFKSSRLPLHPRKGHLLRVLRKLVLCLRVLGQLVLYLRVLGQRDLWYWLRVFLLVAFTSREHRLRPRKVHLRIPFLCALRRYLRWLC